MVRQFVLLLMMGVSFFSCPGFCFADESREIEELELRDQSKRKTKHLNLKVKTENLVELKGEISDLSPELEMQIMHILKKEPSLPELQEQALKYAGIPSHREFRKYRLEARSRNILPTFSYDLDTNRQRAAGGDYRWNLNSVMPNPGAANNVTYNHHESDFGLVNSNSGYRTRGLGAAVDWNLQKLIYDDEVTDILSEQRRFATIRNDFIDQVHSVYSERRRKLVDFLLNPPKTSHQRIIILLEIQELTSKLDSLSGGWFTKALRRRSAN